MTKMFFAAMLVVTGVMVSDADAGVAGGRFEGTLTRASDGATVALVSDFAASGGAFSESFGGFDFPGSFTETNILFLSFWSATYDEDPLFEASGISLFSFVSLYTVNEIDGENDFSGIVFKTGPSQVRVSGTGNSHAGN